MLTWLCVREGLLNINEVVGLLEIAQENKVSHLLVAAFEFGPDVLQLLVSNHLNDQNKLKITAMKLIRGGESGTRDLEDLALLTGAEVISPEKGQKLSNMPASAFGKARRIEGDKNHFLIMGGAGDKSLLREKIAELQRTIIGKPEDDADAKAARERIARLSGSTAILKVGALGKAERTYLHKQAEQGIKAVQHAARDGVVSGGGTAFTTRSNVALPND